MGLLFVVVGGWGGYLIVLQWRGYLMRSTERERLGQESRIVLVDLSGIYRVLSS
jgi:hypothetical protein